MSFEKIQMEMELYLSHDPFLPTFNVPFSIVFERPEVPEALP